MPALVGVLGGLDVADEALPAAGDGAMLVLFVGVRGAASEAALFVGVLGCGGTSEAGDLASEPAELWGGEDLCGVGGKE